ncbi:MAG: nucleoside phosphorylase [Candidatus Odinarchaeota archaeon]
MAEFFNSDKDVYIDPLDSIDSFIKRSGLDTWPKRLIYLPFQLFGVKKRLESAIIRTLPPLYPGTNLYLLQGELLYCEGLIGAPATVILLEELMALGVDEIIFIGIAGSMQPDITIGERLLVTEAVRLEGTSYHYLSPDKLATPSSRMLEDLESFLNAHEVQFHAGKICSIDAPFRESYSLINQFRSEGILAIEMEIAAVYSVCQFRKVEAIALLVISDQLLAEKWTGIERKTFSDQLISTANLMYGFFTGSSF